VSGHSTRRWARALCAASSAVVAALVGCAAERPVAVPLDRCVPEDVLLFAHVRDFPDLRERFEATPYGGLTDEPQVRRLMDGLVALLLTGGAESLPGPVAWADMRDVLSGEVALVVGASTGGADPFFPTMVVADVSGNAEPARLLMEDAAAALAGRMAREGGEPVGWKGAPFGPFRLFRLARRGADDREALSYVVTDRVLAVAAGDCRMLAFLITHQDGVRGGSLAESEGYRLARARMRRSGSIWAYCRAFTQGGGGAFGDVAVYVNPMALVNAYAPEPAAGAEVPAEPPLRPLLHALGLTDVKALGWCAELEDGAVTSRGFAWTPDGRRGLLKAFEPHGMDVAPPAFVDADAALYATFYLSIPRLWKEAKAAAERFRPDLVTMAELMLAGGGRRADVDVERDLIGSLGGRWTAYVPAAVQTPDDPPRLNLAVTVTLSEPARFARAALGLLASAAAERLDGTGGRLWSILLPSGGGGRKLYAAVLADSALVSTSRQLALEVLAGRDGASSPLPGSPGFAAAAAHLDEDADGMIYEDRRLTGPARLRAYGRRLAARGLRLPDPEVLDGYRTPRAMTWKWTDEGLLWKGRQPCPPRRAGAGRHGAGTAAGTN